jgi:hypothetical protein
MHEIEINHAPLSVRVRSTEASFSIVRGCEERQTECVGIGCTSDGRKGARFVRSARMLRVQWNSRVIVRRSTQSATEDD